MHTHPNLTPTQPPTPHQNQIRYFKSLPNTVEGVRRVVSRMKTLPRPEELREEAEEALQGLLSGRQYHTTPSGRRRRSHAFAVAM